MKWFFIGDLKFPHKFSSIVQKTIHIVAHEDIWILIISMRYICHTKHLEIIFQLGRVPTIIDKIWKKSKNMCTGLQDI